ncbi:MAG: hypothetical protein JWL64_2496 [Frankiales bacterium]|nr:hypothetical protein [Frankiales bacterium]
MAHGRCRTGYTGHASTAPLWDVPSISSGRAVDLVDMPKDDPFGPWCKSADWPSVEE